MISRDLQKQRRARATRGKTGQNVNKEVHARQHGQLNDMWYGSKQGQAPACRQELRGREASDRWLNIAMSIYLGLVVVALFLLVLWVLSQFNPLA
jgi:hypothetical protein